MKEMLKSFYFILHPSAFILSLSRGRSALSVADGFGFDDGVVGAGVINQISPVDSEEENAVALGCKLAAAAYEDEIVVIVADDGDERAGQLVAHQLLVVWNGRQTGGRGDTPAAEQDAARSRDAQALPASHHQAAIRPPVGRVVAAHARIDLKEGRRRGGHGRAVARRRRGRRIGARWARLRARLRGVGARGLSARPYAVVARNIGTGTGRREGVELDGVHVLHVELYTAAATARARADEHGELLIFEAYDLPANDAAVLQAHGIGESREAEGQYEQERDERGFETLLHVLSSGSVGSFKDSDKRKSAPEV